MRKWKLILLALLLAITPAQAGTVTPHTVYSTNGTVTAANLNGNVTAILTELNAGLDNENADTSSGYRFLEVKGSLPSPGTEGRVVYLTTNDTLNFDTGAAYTAVPTIVGTPVSGDIIYYDGSNWVRLAKGTAGQILTMNGAATAPSWSTGVPSGVITMWSGTIATIPTGWELADGTCSITCPDLRDRFVVGANSDSGGVAKTNITGSLTTSGGSTTITVANMPAHVHSIPTKNNTSGSSLVSFTGSSGASSSTDTDSAGGGTAYTQPYYSLAYIIKI